MPAPALTNLQRELLDLLALDLPESELVEVRRLLARHFAAKAEAGFEAFADAEGLTTADTDAWAFEHHRRSAGGGRAAS